MRKTGTKRPTAVTRAMGQRSHSTHAIPEAKASGIAREALYKALRSDAQPRFDTINRVCHALGVKLVARPIKA
jgi:probable addiction module antidote protein